MYESIYLIKILAMFFMLEVQTFYFLVNPLPRSDSFAEAEFKTKLAVKTDKDTPNF